MRGYLLALYYMKKARFNFSFMIDGIFFILCFIINLLWWKITTQQKVISLTILMIIILIMLVLSLSWYLELFLRIRKNGFLIFCASLNKGIRNVLFAIISICEIVFLKICVITICIYKMGMRLIEEVNILENVVFLEIDIIFFLLFFLNMNLLISIIVAALIKDKSLTYLFSNVMVGIITMLFINYVNIYGCTWKEFVIILIIFLCLYIFLEIIPMIMRRRNIIEKG